MKLIVVIGEAALDVAANLVVDVEIEIDPHPHTARDQQDEAEFEEEPAEVDGLAENTCWSLLTKCSRRKQVVIPLRHVVSAREHIPSTWQ